MTDWLTAACAPAPMGTARSASSPDALRAGAVLSLAISLAITAAAAALLAPWLLLCRRLRRAAAAAVAAAGEEAYDADSCAGVRSHQGLPAACVPGGPDEWLPPGRTDGCAGGVVAAAATAATFDADEDSLRSTLLPRRPPAAAAASPGSAAAGGGARAAMAAAAAGCMAVTLGLFPGVSVERASWAAGDAGHWQAVIQARRATL
jgi:hypothetical protein